MFRRKLPPDARAAIAATIEGEIVSLHQVADIALATGAHPERIEAIIENAELSAVRVAIENKVTIMVDLRSEAARALLGKK
jgi:hypothetical protein